MTFMEWWAAHGSMDYGEKVITKEAWGFQQRQIDELKAQLKTAEAENARLREVAYEHEVNASFYKSCALSGEVPKDGSEPYPTQQGD